MPAEEPEGMGDAWYSYAIVSIVPRVERGESLNVGIILFARTAGFLEAKIEVNEVRLRALAVKSDVPAIRSHLETFQRIAAGDPDAGPIALLSQSERFHWLTSPRSTIIQTSAIHAGRCDDPAVAIEELMEHLVR